MDDTATTDEEWTQGSSDESDSDFSTDASDTYRHEKDSKILNRYRELSSRRVDLVGDYAGDEPFIIEGDSLLLHIFSDETLDLEFGCQVLHAAYNIEKFLANLLQRKCRFSLVFFQSSRQLCVPRSAKYPSRYLLARAVIIRHLQANLARHIVNVRVFDAWSSSVFLDYLHEASPYFIMAHDGASVSDRQSKFMTEDSADQPVHPSRVDFRRMILSFIGRGFNIALVNGMEWQDSKVMTMVLETRQRMVVIPAQPQNPVVTLIDTSDDVHKLSAYPELTERQILAIAVIAHLLRQKPDLANHCLAILRHQAILAHTSLLDRRIPINATEVTEQMHEFLNELASTAESILYHPQWRTSIGSEVSCDVYDAIDGRLFFSVFIRDASEDDKIDQTFQKMLDATQGLMDTALTISKTGQSTSPFDHTSSVGDAPSDLDRDIAVLPFSNRIFDKHLQSVQLEVDKTVETRSAAASQIFHEVSHWHNSRRPLAKKGAPPPAKDSKQIFWANRRNQQFMAEMLKYAASLTNAIGRSLEPETIIVGQARQVTIPSATAESDASDASSKNPEPKKSGGKGKTAQKNAAKQAMLDKIAADRSKKVANIQDNHLEAWQVVCKDFESETEFHERYRKAKNHLGSISKASWETVAPECELYMLTCLVKCWISACRRKEQNQGRSIAALVWNHARHIAQFANLPKSIRKQVEMTVDALQLPPVAFNSSSNGLPDRKLAFELPLPLKDVNLSVGLSHRDFQLIEAGPYLDRSFNTKPDARVDFQPDEWQRKVLDAIDEDQSVFVVAPTSAGKTFISFYAMRKILQADDDGVIVYVAPTKALVNQLAAEIQARFSKSFKYGGKSVWAIHTRDYRINNPTGCQVLVTVPHILQIMLLAGSHAKSWSSRVRRIIFDEIHSIGQAEDGVVWEQLLLMAPCPIVALSATVGNPDKFSDWLASTQEAIGNKLVTIQHPYRYSDLRKHYYVSPKGFDFAGIPDRRGFGVLGLEGLPGFNRIHPVAGLVDRSRGIPDDLALEPADCLSLWKAMVKVGTEKYPVTEDLDPTSSLPDICRKEDVLLWERKLKAVLKSWIQDPNSPYAQLMVNLEQDFRTEPTESVYQTNPSVRSQHVNSIADADDLTSSTLPLLCRLQEQDALPAILFNYDRHQCEKIARSLTEQLHDAEAAQHKSGPGWEKQIQQWEDWKKAKSKATSKTAKVVAKSKSKNQDDEKSSKLDLQKEAGTTSGDAKWESFDPLAPIVGYHFADYSRLQESELNEYMRELRHRTIQSWLIEMLPRGIGIHHAGMNRKYRQVVEILFRKGFLRVVIATGTLALGINMPCKTVVFSGDSVFLTALNYRQCAGRAGRRGFDLLGNIVFQGITRQKVCRLMSSRLPELNGHFPITTTLVLRLFTLLSDSKQAPYAETAINGLLSQPRLHMGGDSFKAKTMHHLRFSIEYLRRQHLLGMDGSPLNFAGLVSHLYFTENSSFAFHTLLKEGYFHDLCANVRHDEKGTLETLMLVMAHLFNRKFCRQADAEYLDLVKKSSSTVFLPRLPSGAAKILTEHNQQVLQIYHAYVSSYVSQHIDSEDRELPLTGIHVGPLLDTPKGAKSQPLPSLPPVRLRSPFLALSGLSDDFASIHDLCTGVRDGIFLEEAVIPSMALYPDESQVPLNAYLLDFYKHGDVRTLERANGIRQADVWFYLNDFSLVLATIVTSLRNFVLKGEFSGDDNEGMEDLMGQAEALEEQEEAKLAKENDTASEISEASKADSGIGLPVRAKDRTVNIKKKSKVESWEDEADEENEDEEAAKAAERAEKEFEEMIGEPKFWEGKGGKGLLDVLDVFEKLQAEFNVKFRAMWA